MISLNFLFVEYRNKTDWLLDKNEIHNRSMEAKSEFEPFKIIGLWFLCYVLKGSWTESAWCDYCYVLIVSLITFDHEWVLAKFPGKWDGRGVVSGVTFTTHLGWSFIQWCFKAIGISLQDCALCIWITTLFWSFSAYNWKESYSVSTSQNFLHFPWVRLFSLLWWYQRKQSSWNLYN